MSTTTAQNIDADHGTQAWDLLSQRLEAFVECWESSTDPPKLADYLPASPPALRRLALVELIKVDLDYQWNWGRQPRRLEQYLEEFPELGGRDGVPCDLIYEEFHVRRQAGDKQDPAEVITRFPRQATQLGRLLNLEDKGCTTSLFSGGRVETPDVGGEIDDFDLLAQLGKGAFATVFLARQRSMQRMVALKISKDQGTEPQTLARLDHPHIVRVYDQRTLADSETRLLYMQYVPGGTLQPVVASVRTTPPMERTGQLLLSAIDRALDQRGDSAPDDLPIRRRLQAADWPTVVCWLGARLARALEYAHREKVLHRDVKPANVLLAVDGSPKLADFNISYSAELEGVTPAAFFGGSLPYMSTEQLEACNPDHPRQADELDGRSDVYSLGVLLWELLTGTRPFRDQISDDGWLVTLQGMTAERHAGVSEAVRAQLPPNCPPGLEQALCRALEPNPQRRFASAGALARELELCLQPHTQELMCPPKTNWRRLVRRLGMVALALAAIVPNAATSGLNIAYNLKYIKGEGVEPAVQAAFYDVQLISVNAGVYAVGLMLLGLLAWPVCNSVRHLTRLASMPTAEQPALQNRCLRLGEYAAVISFCGWVLTGLIFPAWIERISVTPGLDGKLWLHFVASCTLCGLFAATLSFFLVTFLSVRCLYPPLLQADQNCTGDAPATGELQRLARRTGIYFLLAAITPFLMITTLAFFDTETQGAFLMIGPLGLLGFMVSWGLNRQTQRDLAALVVSTSPPGASLAAESMTFDSFWSSR